MKNITHQRRRYYSLLIWRQQIAHLFKEWLYSMNKTQSGLEIVLIPRLFRPSKHCYKQFISQYTIVIFHSDLVNRVEIVLQWKLFLSIIAWNYNLHLAKKIVNLVGFCVNLYLSSLIMSARLAIIYSNSFWYSVCSPKVKNFVIWDKRWPELIVYDGYWHENFQ